MENQPTAEQVRSIAERIILVQRTRQAMRPSTVKNVMLQLHGTTPEQMTADAMSELRIEAEQAGMDMEAYDNMVEILTDDTV